jgi:LacI family transcriptional regulator
MRTQSENAKPPSTSGRGGSCRHPSRVTQSDIARAAGVHSTTVSQALKNSPTISRETRERIQALAREMGYVPDPALSALVAYRRNVVALKRIETVALVTNGARRLGWREHAPSLASYEGMAERAAAFGYRLEHFWFGGAGMSGRRLGDMLGHRGIAGAIFAFHREGRPEPLGFAWSSFACVQLGRGFREVDLQRVDVDETGPLVEALLEARQRGKHRVATLLSTEFDGAWATALQTALAVEPAFASSSERVAIPSLDLETLARFGEGRDGEALALSALSDFSRWFFQFRPEVLVGSAEAISEAFARLGLRLPEAVEVIDPAAGAERSGGMRARKLHRAGAVAIDQLHQLLQLNQRGLPEFPATTLVATAGQGGRAAARELAPERERGLA